MTQVAAAVGKTHKSTGQFLTGNSLQALPYKGFRAEKIKVEGEASAREFTEIPLEIAAAYWTYWAFKGNENAQALTTACVSEALERRADAAFNVKREEDERNALFVARRQGIEARNSFTDAVDSWFEGISPTTKKALQIKQPAYHYFTMDVYEKCGLKQAYLGYKKVYQDDKFRDNLDAHILRQLECFEDTVAMVMVKQKVCPPSAIEFVAKNIGLTKTVKVV